MCLPRMRRHLGVLGTELTYLQPTILMSFVKVRNRGLCKLCERHARTPAVYTVLQLLHGLQATLCWLQNVSITAQEEVSVISI